jgi:hypothetical protein
MDIGLQEICQGRVYSLMALDQAQAFELGRYNPHGKVPSPIPSSSMAGMLGAVISYFKLYWLQYRQRLLNLRNPVCAHGNTGLKG